MFTLSKEAAIQKNLAPKTGLARVNERQGTIWRFDAGPQAMLDACLV